MKAPKTEILGALTRLGIACRKREETPGLNREPGRWKTRRVLECLPVRRTQTGGGPPPLAADGAVAGAPVSNRPDRRLPAGRRWEAGTRLETFPNRGLEIRDPADWKSAPPCWLRYDVAVVAPLLLGALLLQLCSAHAQTFSIPWHTMDGGGGTSTGGDFSVSGTIGQPDAGVMSGGPFTLTGGFWALPSAVQTPGAPTLSITPGEPGLATISWTPATGTDWILQERPSLSSGSWINSPSGTANPVTVPATLPAKFYRLFKP